MFERYTEKARRAVFFARYEASHFGSECIETDHLLLGILRDDKDLVRQVLPELDFESGRRHIEQRAKASDVKFPVSVDLPLSADAKLVLKYSMEEADRLKSPHIGTEHLLLALMREKDFSSAKLLAQFGVSLDSIRKRVEALPEHTPIAQPSPQLSERVADSVRAYRRAFRMASTIEIHGRKWNLEEVRNLVVRLKSQPYIWKRKLWQARDIVYEKNGKRFSFDTTLAKDKSKFILVKGGWTKDYCTVCRWELFETDDATHGTAHSNGKDWVCAECYRRFIEGDYFVSAHSDIT